MSLLGGAARPTGRQRVGLRLRPRGSPMARPMARLKACAASHQNLNPHDSSGSFQKQRAMV